MWETKIGRSIARHFLTHEGEDVLAMRCRRCAVTALFSSLTPLIYLLGEATHHLQATHGFPGAAGDPWGYLDAIPAPENPS